MTTLDVPVRNIVGDIDKPRGGALAALVRHSVALARRSLIKTIRTPEALIDVTLQPVIFLLLFTYLFGGAISGGDRHAYLQFLLPGMLAQSLAMGGIALGQNLNADIEKGVFDRFRSLPVARSAPLVGAVAADIVRYLTVCVVMLGFGMVMGFRVETGFVPAVAAVALSIGFGLCFCWISVWVGMLVRTSGAVQGVMFLLVFPLSFGSNVFVQTSTLPGWLQAFVHVNPITPLVGTIRGLLVGGPVAGHLMAHAGLDGRAAGGLRAARAAGLRPPGLTIGRRQTPCCATAPDRPGPRPSSRPAPNPSRTPRRSAPRRAPPGCGWLSSRICGSVRSWVPRSRAAAPSRSATSRCRPSSSASSAAVTATIARIGMSRLSTAAAYARASAASAPAASPCPQAQRRPHRADERLTVVAADRELAGHPRLGQLDQLLRAVQVAEPHPHARPRSASTRTTISGEADRSARSRAASIMAIARSSSPRRRYRSIQRRSMKISSAQAQRPELAGQRPGLAQVGQRAVEVAVVLPQQRAHRQRGGQAPAVAGPAEGVERGGHVGAYLVEVALVLGELGPEHLGQPGQPDVRAVDEALDDQGERRLGLLQEVRASPRPATPARPGSDG